METTLSETHQLAPDIWREIIRFSDWRDRLTLASLEEKRGQTVEFWSDINLDASDLFVHFFNKNYQTRAELEAYEENEDENEETVWVQAAETLPWIQSLYWSSADSYLKTKTHLSRILPYFLHLKKLIVPHVDNLDPYYFTDHQHQKQSYSITSLKINHYTQKQLLYKLSFCPFTLQSLDLTEMNDYLEENKTFGSLLLLDQIGEYLIEPTTPIAVHILTLPCLQTLTILKIDSYHMTLASFQQIFKLPQLTQLHFYPSSDFEISVVNTDLSTLTGLQELTRSLTIYWFYYDLATVKRFISSFPRIEWILQSLVAIRKAKRLSPFQYDAGEEMNQYPFDDEIDNDDVDQVQDRYELNRS